MRHRRRTARTENSQVNGLIEFVKTLGAARGAAMGAATAILIGSFAFVIMHFSQPTMAPLFTELTLDDSGRIVKELETQGIPYELRGDGTTVFVPKTQVTKLRMQLAETGLPRGGSVGYEIFDKSDAIEWADGGVTREHAAIEARINEAVARYLGSSTKSLSLPDLESAK
jgi:flagellar biosynthesis/type III secretory pathway M-ring protein FliF/YscJ